MGPTKVELEERVAELEQALEEAMGVIGEALGAEVEGEDEEGG